LHVYAAGCFLFGEKFLEALLFVDNTVLLLLVKYYIDSLKKHWYYYICIIQLVCLSQDQ